MYINNSCRYQSITQQYLKICLIKDDSNYMFRPVAGIITFSSESMVVVLYRIGMFMSRRWDLKICDVCVMLLLRDTGVAWGRGWEVSVMCAILGCTAQVCLLAAVLCGSPAVVCPFRYLLQVGFCYGFFIKHLFRYCFVIDWYLHLLSQWHSETQTLRWHSDAETP